MPSTADPPRPRTPAQVEAARRNGALSRGPVTAEGKARSAGNALKHGLRSAEFGLLPDEDAAAWEAHLAAVRATYRPEDPVEVHLVEGIAVAQWRELRADRVEADVMSDIRPAFSGRSHGTNLVARDDARAGTGTALRYRSQAQLEVQRATALLRRHRQDRAAGLIPPPEDGPGPAAADENGRNDPGGGPTSSSCPGATGAPPGQGQVSPPPVGRPVEPG